MYMVEEVKREEPFKRHLGLSRCECLHVQFEELND